MTYLFALYKKYGPRKEVPFFETLTKETKSDTQVHVSEKPNVVAHLKPVTN